LVNQFGIELLLAIIYKDRRYDGQAQNQEGRNLVTCWIIYN